MLNNTSLYELELKNRTFFALRRWGIRTVEELLSSGHSEGVRASGPPTGDWVNREYDEWEWVSVLDEPPGCTHLRFFDAWVDIAGIGQKGLDDIECSLDRWRVLNQRCRDIACPTKRFCEDPECKLARRYDNADADRG